MKIRVLNIAFSLPLLFVFGVTVGVGADASDKTEKNAFVLVAVDGMPANNTVSFDYTFRQVDVESGAFLKNVFTVSFTSVGSGKDEIKKPKDLETTLRFGGRTAFPGDYALVSTKTRRRFGGTRRHDDTRCFALGSIVYRIRGNQTNLTYVGDTLGRNYPIDQSKLQTDASTFIATNSRLSAPAVPAEVVGMITFDGTKDGRYCMDPKQFIFTPMTR